MQLCLSARMFTVPGTGNQFSLDIEAFVEFALQMGYDGICLRAGQLDAGTSDVDVDGIRSVLDARNAACSFVMTTAVDESAFDGVCRIVDHAAKIGCHHVQPSVRESDEIPWIQRLCDYAAEREVRISPQLHDSTLHDTVENCLILFEEVDRENFGLNFEASHLLLQGAPESGAEAVRRLADRIFTLCVQNYRRSHDGSVAVLPGDPDGVDFEELFRAIREIGFDGFVTHMSGAYPDLDNETVCRTYVEAIRPLMEKGS